MTRRRCSCRDGGRARRRRRILGAAGQLRPAVAEVAREPVRCLLAERHDPFLAALAEHAHRFLLEVDVGEVEPDRLLAPQPGRVDQLSESSVAERERPSPRATAARGPRRRACRRGGDAWGVAERAGRRGRGPGRARTARAPVRLRASGRSWPAQAVSVALGPRIAAYSVSTRTSTSSRPRPCCSSQRAKPRRSDRYARRVASESAPEVRNRSIAASALMLNEFAATLRLPPRASST